MVWLVLGIAIYLVVFLDIIYTTFSLRGGGFLSSRVAHVCWKILVSLRKSFKSPGLLQMAGMMIIIIVFLQWLLLVWGASIMIVSADAHAIINSQTKASAGLLEKIYVTGYTLSTMGNGDYSGGTNGWKVFLALISFSGIVMVTVSLTYFVQVLSNVNKKRVLANAVNGLGSSVDEILMNAWNGKDFTRLNNHLMQLSQQVTTLGEIHLSFPVLHYYYSHDRSKSLSINLALLDETLTVLMTRVPSESKPDALVMQVTRAAIRNFLGVLHNNFIRMHPVVPPYPDLSNLLLKGIPIQPFPDESQNNQQLTQQRQLLSGLLQDEGRDWSDL